MKKIPYALLTLLLLAGCDEKVSDAEQETVQPQIYPDYVGVTIPANIAPLNFCMADEAALRIDAVITDRHGHSLHSQGSEAVDFDIDGWHDLLGQNLGDSLTVTVSAKTDGGWHTYLPFSFYVSPDSIDYGLCYRLIAPGYEVWSKMGIYERNLSTFDERPLIENTQFEGCVNCHSFNRGNPDDMSLHIRGPHGATLLRSSQSTGHSSPSTVHHSRLGCGPLTAYNTKTNQTLGFCVYPYWHPSGRYIAYSTNATSQLFHAAHANRIEVFDTASDLQVYDVEKNELILSPLLKQDSVYETYPVFSADGRSIYFCAARALPEGHYQLDSIRYSLCRIDFDPQTGTFGNRIDTIVAVGEASKLRIVGEASKLCKVGEASKLCRADAVGEASKLCRLDAVGEASKLCIVGEASKLCRADAVGEASQLCRADAVGEASQLCKERAVPAGYKSVSFPRPSYDGRFLCYTLSDYGQFSIWHHEADLYLLDLRTGESRPMTEANSDDTESFHNWSTNSRWLVFSSRRDDGLFTRLYFCHIDAEGHVTKAFMLPQRNPRRFYRDRFFSFNVPEFIIRPTRFDGHQASRLINDDERKNFGVRH